MGIVNVMHFDFNVEQNQIILPGLALCVQDELPEGTQRAFDAIQ